jgi:transcriptional regulator with XRE-family HTH domain
MVRVREARMRLGLSQRELGEISGYDPAVICRIETGKVSPNLATLDRIADALDVETADLLKRRRETVAA